MPRQNIKKAIKAFKEGDAGALKAYREQAKLNKGCAIRKYSYKRTTAPKRKVTKAEYLSILKEKKAEIVATKGHQRRLDTLTRVLGVNYNVANAILLSAFSDGLQMGLNTPLHKKDKI